MQKLGFLVPIPYATISLILLARKFWGKNKLVSYHIVNDQLSALGAYLKTKAFRRVLLQTGHFFRSGHLLNKNEKTKCEFFTKIT